MLLGDHRHRSRGDGKVDGLLGDGAQNVIAVKRLSTNVIARIHSIVR